MKIFRLSCFFKLFIVVLCMLWSRSAIAAYSTYNSTACVGLQVTYTTDKNGQAAGYTWSISGGTLNVDYQIVAGSTATNATTNYITILWQTAGTRTVFVKYKGGAEYAEAFRVTATQQLNGTYYIRSDGSGQFASLQEAAAVYNSCGISGPTVLKISSNITESSTVEFLGSAPGSTNDNNTLTITTDGSRYAVSANVNGPIVRLRGANNVIIDGISPASAANLTANKLVFVNASAASANVSEITVVPNGASQGKNIAIKNVELYNSNASISLVVGVNNLGVQTANGITISGCYLHEANENVLLQGVINLTFTDNVVRNAKNTGVAISATAANSYIISRNDIGSVSASGSSLTLLQGINLSATGGGNFIIEDNKIRDINSTATGASGVYGVFLKTDGALQVNRNTSTNITNVTLDKSYNTVGMQIVLDGNGTATLDKNTVSAISGSNHPIGIDINASSAAAMATLTNNTAYAITAASGVPNNFASGIRFNVKGAVSNAKVYGVAAYAGVASGIYCEQSFGQATLFNNMVFDVEGKTANGFSLQGGNSAYRIYQNSIRLQSANSTSDLTTCLRVGDGSGESGTITKADVRNNIFSNEITTGTTNYATYVTTGSGYTSSGNNRYQTVSSIGYYWWGARTFVAWKGFSKDSGSYVASIPFRSATDLHLTTYPAGMLVPVISGYATDVDGNGRTYSACSGNNMPGIDVGATTITRQLSGNYIIATPSAATPNPDYTSLKQVADIYNSCGLVGNTTFTISSDLEESETVELLGSAPNSQTYSLLITTDNNRRMVSVNDPYAAVRLKAANNITIDGKTPINNGNNLLVVKNIYPDNTFNGITTITVQKDGGNSGQNIIIKNTELCNAVSNEPGVTNLWINIDKVAVEGCYLHDANQGVYVSNNNGYVTLANNKIASLTGIGIKVDGSSYPKDYAIVGNTISNFTASTKGGILCGIRLAASAADKFTITGNTIQNLNNTGVGGATGMYLQADGVLDVKNNTISGIGSTATGYTAVGIECQHSYTYSGTANIERNTVSSISSVNTPFGITVATLSSTALINIAGNTVYAIAAAASTAGSNATGIQMNAQGTLSANKIYDVTAAQGLAMGVQAQPTFTATPPLLVNNMIYGIKGGQTATGFYLKGNNAAYQVYHNSVRFTEKYTDAGETRCLMLGINGTTDNTTADVQNNLFSNEVANGGAGNYIFLCGSSGGVGATFSTIKNNRYYVLFGFVGLYKGTPYDFSGYSDASTWGAATNDVGSYRFAYSEDIFFNNRCFDAGDPLHLTAEARQFVYLNVALLPAVTMDYDGDVRSICSSGAGADNNESGMALTKVDPTMVCEGGQPALYITVVGSAGPYQYSIDGGTLAPVPNPTSSGNDFAFLPTQFLTSGEHTISIQGGNGCAASKIFTIAYTPLPTKPVVTPERAIICDPTGSGSGSSTLTANTYTGTTITYAWYKNGSAAAVLGATASTLTVAYSEVGAYQAQVTVDGCTSLKSDSVEVAVSIPTVAISCPATLAPGQDDHLLVSLSNLAGGTITWSSSNASVVTADSIGEDGGKYLVTGYYAKATCTPGAAKLTYIYTDANACLLTGECNVTVSALATPAITDTISDCDFVVFGTENRGAGYVYEWTVNGVVDNSSTSYSIQVSSISSAEQQFIASVKYQNTYACYSPASASAEATAWGVAEGNVTGEQAPNLNQTYTYTADLPKACSLYAVQWNVEDAVRGVDYEEVSQRSDSCAYAVRWKKEGAFTVTYTLSYHGCQGYVELFTVSPIPTAALCGAGETICQGEAAELTVEIVGGSLPYTLVLNDGISDLSTITIDTLDVNNRATIDVTPSAIGDVVYTIKSAQDGAGINMGIISCSN